MGQFETVRTKHVTKQKTWQKAFNFRVQDLEN